MSGDAGERPATGASSLASGRSNGPFEMIISSCQHAAVSRLSTATSRPLAVFSSWRFAARWPRVKAVDAARAYGLAAMRFQGQSGRRTRCRCRRCAPGHRRGRAGNSAGRPVWGGPRPTFSFLCSAGGVGGTGAGQVCPGCPATRWGCRPGVTHLPGAPALTRSANARHAAGLKVSIALSRLAVSRTRIPPAEVAVSTQFPPLSPL
jgi:hypothetical protein